MSRSVLAKGKSVSLQTTFNGRPAPGGAFYPETGHYRKTVKGPKGGRHPYRNALGGIDEPIVQELQRRECKTVELRLADGSVHYCCFQDLVTLGFSVRWKDKRFPQRHYLDSSFWCSTAEGLRERERTLEAEKAQRRLQTLKAPQPEQMSLFGQDGPDMGLRMRYEA